MIDFQDSFSTLPSKKDKNICFKGIYTEPKLIFNKNISIKVIIKNINVFLYDFIGFKNYILLKMLLIF